MNIAKAYHSIIKPATADEEQPKEQSAGRAEITHSWLQSTVTQEMFSSMAEDEQKCIDLAIRQACNVGNEINYNLIVQLLVRADTLRKLKLEYGKM